MGLVGRQSSVHDSISIFDAVPPPPLVKDVKTEHFVLSPKFNGDRFAASAEGEGVTATIPDPVTPIALFDAMNDGETDSGTPVVCPLIPLTDMTPDVHFRPTLDADFLTPARLRDIRDNGNAGDDRKNIRANRSMIASISQPLLQRKTDSVLLPRSDAYFATAFLRDQTATLVVDAMPLGSSDPALADDIFCRASPEFDNHAGNGSYPIANVVVDKLETPVHDEHSTENMVVIRLLEERESDYLIANATEFQGNDSQEQREDSSFIPCHSHGARWKKMLGSPFKAVRSDSVAHLHAHFLVIRFCS